MKLYKDKNIEFRFDIGGDILVVKFLNEHPVFSETAQFTGAIELINAKRILLDLSVVKDFSSDAKELLIEDLTKQLMGHGVRKLAILKSPNDKINSFIEQIIKEKQPPRLKIRFFDTYSDATVWLKDNYSKD